MRVASALVLAMALTACAASRSGPTKAQLGYLTTHPLSVDEARRLENREARRGDTIDRVRVTFDGCDMERQSHDGALEVWRVHVPIDGRPIRVDTDKLEEIAAGRDAFLTFDNGQLVRAALLE